MNSSRYASTSRARPRAPVPAPFDAAEAAAIGEAPRRVPGYTYGAVSDRVMAAGCAGYLVSLSGRRVVYFGRSGETHAEQCRPEEASMIANVIRFVPTGRARPSARGWGRDHENRHLADEWAVPNAAHQVFEPFEVAAQRLAAPSHSHDGFEETIYGIEGVLTWNVDGQQIDVGPRHALCIPRGAVHRFDNTHSKDAKVLCVVTPAALGPRFFRDAAEVIAAAAGGPPDPARMVAVMRAHGLTPVAPPPA